MEIDLGSTGGSGESGDGGVAVAFPASTTAFTTADSTIPASTSGADTVSN